MSPITSTKFLTAAIVANALMAIDVTPVSEERTERASLTPTRQPKPKDREKGWREKKREKNRLALRHTLAREDKS